ncbi:MAG: endonuclease V [Chloroflexi bacterium RBG_16_54_18]|nr:MAG: endonuclease V [Chloroflexi bacterium RBG_16_54_18]
MQFRQLHDWDVNPQQAIAIQEQLRDQVIRQDQFGAIRAVAGVDVGFISGNQVARAAVAVLRFPALDLQEVSRAENTAGFPYVPGLLSFREIPVVLEALSHIKTLPDLLICDGHGLAHPRRFGLASHLGLICGLPSIGAAKSLLIGQHAAVGAQRGDWQPLIDHGEVIGAAVRTRLGARPVYVSIGHLLSLDSAIDFVLRCTRGFRLPETTRHAHRLASGENNRYNRAQSSSEMTKI